jgi:adenosylhomocysteinase
VTGNRAVIRREHFEAMRRRDRAGQQRPLQRRNRNPALEDLAASTREVRPFVREYRMRDGRRLYLLAEGRLFELGRRHGHPAAVMDMSFANQVLVAEYLEQRGKTLAPNVYAVPNEIDQSVARLKLDAMDIRIDELTIEQRKYLQSWQDGT